MGSEPHGDANMLENLTSHDEKFVPVKNSKMFKILTHFIIYKYLKTYN